MRRALSLLPPFAAVISALALAVPEGKENPFAVWKRPIRPPEKASSWPGGGAMGLENGADMV